MQFDSLINAGFDSHSRLQLYNTGLNQFLDYPLLGNSFIACPGEYQWGDHPEFWPARYHNTYVQFLATAGLIGLISYIIHRFQTLVLLFKNNTLESIFLKLFDIYQKQVFY